MLVEYILKATLISKIVFFILLSLSIAVWTLFIYNIIYFRRIEKKNEEFLNFFYSSRNFVDIIKDVEKFFPSPLARVTSEWIALKDEKRIGLESKRILEDISKFQFFFATTASTAPFIGLFGTVWGVMFSFHEIGRMKSATLDIVAPGIAEALFATAVGLLAAIPAAISYNFFQSKIKKQMNLMETFIPDLIMK